MKRFTDCEKGNELRKNFYKECEVNEIYSRFEKDPQNNNYCNTDSM